MMTKSTFSALLLSFVLLNAGCGGSGPALSTNQSPETSSGGELDGLTGTLPEASTIVLDVVETPRIEPNTSPTARTYRLSLGASAPADGLLLNDEAAAFLIAEMEAFQARVTAALEVQRDRDLARLNLEVGELRLEITSDRERFGVIIAGRDREIIRLMEMNESFVERSNEFPWDTVLIGVGGLVLGLLGGFIFGLVAGL
jgi:hypothetical protein